MIMDIKTVWEPVQRLQSKVFYQAITWNDNQSRHTFPLTNLFLQAIHLVSIQDEPLIQLHKPSFLAVVSSIHYTWVSNIVDFLITSMFWVLITWDLIKVLCLAPNRYVSPRPLALDLFGVSHMYGINEGGSFKSTWEVFLTSCSSLLGKYTKCYTYFISHDVTMIMIIHLLNLNAIMIISYLISGTLFVTTVSFLGLRGHIRMWKKRKNTTNKSWWTI